MLETAMDCFGRCDAALAEKLEVRGNEATGIDWRGGNNTVAVLK